MLLKKEERYNARMEINRNCKTKVQEGRFIVIFSFKIDNYDERFNKAIISEINPPQVINLFRKFKNFFLLSEQKDKIYQTSAKISSILSNDSIEIEIDTNDIMIDHRKYQRYKFCPEDLGKFKIYESGSLVTEDSNIIELSARGARIIYPEGKKINGNLIELYDLNGNKFFDVKIHKSERYINFNSLRGEIDNSHINVTEFILKSYIKIYKKVIKNME